MTFLSELYDEEFDEALFELMHEAAAVYDERHGRPSGELSARDPAAERFLEAHFEPLTRELERGLTALSERFGHADAGSLNLAELEAFLDQYAPVGEVNPAFEHFLGKAFKKIGRVVKKAASVAGKLALGPFFAKLRALLPEFLKGVLKRGISRLPPELQPAAQKVAERLGLLRELEAEDQEGSVLAEVSRMQHSFNRELADLLFAPGEVEQELEVSRAVREAQAPLENPLAELDEARERFISGLSRLKEGEEPAPLMENFIPALLPVLKLGLKLAGRTRVVNFLSQLLAKLIGKLVGPANAPVLSRAIVEAGLRLVNLEASPQAEAGAAASAVAATVEDTVRRVSLLPEYVLDDLELLEAFTLEAFEQAATANLPQLLSEEAYQKRPDLRETKSLRGAWIALPLRGRKRYKKFLVPGALRTRITPQKARSVESFGGVSLADFLQEQLGMPPGADVETEVHLYESIPGTALPEVARLERGTPGLGEGTERAYAQLHPLTPEAAGILLGEPALGRPLHPAQIANRYAIQPGQRFYYLSLRGAKPVLPKGGKGRGRMRRPSGMKLTLDFPAGQLRACLYLSEVKSQSLAVKLRQQAHLGVALAPLRALLQRDLACLMRGGGWGRVKIIHEAVAPYEALGGALQRVPSVVLGTLCSRLQECILKAVAEFLKQQPQQLVAATEAPADGSTLVVTIDSPPGFESLRQALRGRAPSLAELKGGATEPAVAISVVAGYANA